MSYDVEEVRQQLLRTARQLESSHARPAGQVDPAAVDELFGSLADHCRTAAETLTGSATSGQVSEALLLDAATLNLIGMEVQGLIRVASHATAARPVVYNINAWHDAVALVSRARFLAQTLQLSLTGGRAADARSATAA